MGPHAGFDEFQSLFSFLRAWKYLESGGGGINQGLKKKEAMDSPAPVLPATAKKEEEEIPGIPSDVEALILVSPASSSNFCFEGLSPSLAVSIKGAKREEDRDAIKTGLTKD